LGANGIGGRAMVRAVLAQSAGHWTWWLQVDTGGGCDVLVRGLGQYPHEAACRAALHTAAKAVEADPLAVLSVQTADGHWHVRFHDTKGSEIATSARQFPTAAASLSEIGRLTRAFTTARPFVVRLTRTTAPRQSARQHPPSG
jgi:hypothetical protein